VRRESYTAVDSTPWPGRPRDNRLAPGRPPGGRPGRVAYCQGFSLLLSLSQHQRTLGRVGWEWYPVDRPGGCPGPCGIRRDPGAGAAGPGRDRKAPPLFLRYFPLPTFTQVSSMRGRSGATFRRGYMSPRGEEGSGGREISPPATGGGPGAHPRYAALSPFRPRCSLSVCGACAGWAGGRVWRRAAGGGPAPGIGGSGGSTPRTAGQYGPPEGLFRPCRPHQ
jgi:hypothetical protein